MEKYYKDEDKQFAIDERYLKMAFIWSTNSYAVRRQVGALLVKDGQIISDGYNGTPTGFTNCCEYAVEDGKIINFTDRVQVESYRALCGDDSVITLPEVLHAESNTLSKVSRSTSSSEGATMYITDAPCFNCSKMIIQAGIKRVVYAREYRNTEGIDLLEKAGIEIVHHPIVEYWKLY